MEPMSEDVSIINIEGQPYRCSSIMYMNLPYETEPMKTAEREELSRLEYLIKLNETNNNTDVQNRFGVELLVLVDYAIFYKFYMTSMESSEADKQEDAIQNIRYYFSHIVNGIDNRYSSFANSNFSIYIRKTGYIIAMTPEDSPWTELYKVDGTTLVDEMYTSLREWLLDNEKYLPNYDVAALFTGNQIFTGAISIDDKKKIISGFSRAGVACSSHRIAISYEFGQYSTITTAAHEIAHNLGAYHDGDANPCSFDDQYIMASRPTATNNVTYGNTYKFSTCSVEYFKSYINRLSKRMMNCLENDATLSKPLEFDQFLKEYPGQKYTADVQCQMLYGANSFYCGGGSRDRSICREMECWSPQELRCVAKLEQRAADGTICANKSWCRMGDCVWSESAPVLDTDYCIYGDYMDTFNETNGSSVSCKILAVDRPYLCYDEAYEQMCCETCQRLKNQSAFEDCVYGDREPEWCLANLQTSDCYNDTIRSRCCQSCAKANSGVADCPYGDKDSSCTQLISSNIGLCGQYGTTCCKSCRRYNLAQLACPYGDFLGWCPSYILENPKDCSRLYYSALCCFSCYLSSYNLLSPPSLTTKSDLGFTTTKITSSIRSAPITSKITQSSTARPSSLTTKSDLGFTTIKTTNPIRSTASTSRMLQSTTTGPSSTKPDLGITKTTNDIRSTPITSSMLHSNTTSHLPYTPTMNASLENNTTSTLMVSLSTHSVHTTPVLTDYTSTQQSYNKTSTQRTAMTSEESTTTSTVLITTLTSLTTTSSIMNASTNCSLKDGAIFCPKISARDCYYHPILCCESCSKYHTGIKGCEYGDKASWCSSYVQGREECERLEVADYCCQTCRQVFNRTEEHPDSCDDKARWCKNMFPGYCYDPAVTKTCCKSCREFHRFSKDCPYGDMFSWCSKEYCKMDALECCETCKNFSE